MSKQLKFFNGRWATGRRLAGHAYIAAYSRADAARLIEEFYGYPIRGVMNELKVYWSEGCWGRPMDGITPERGIWVQEDRAGKPIRIYPKQAI